MFRWERFRSHDRRSDRIVIVAVPVDRGKRHWIVVLDVTVVEFRRLRNDLHRRRSVVAAFLSAAFASRLDTNRRPRAPMRYSRECSTALFGIGGRNADLNRLIASVAKSAVGSRCTTSGRHGCRRCAARSGTHQRTALTCPVQPHATAGSHGRGSQHLTGCCTVGAARNSAIEQQVPSTRTAPLSARHADNHRRPARGLEHSNCDNRDLRHGSPAPPHEVHDQDEQKDDQEHIE
jgi:hypothetical protein